MNKQKLSDWIYLLDVLEKNEEKQSIKQIYEVLKKYEINLLKWNILAPSFEARSIAKAWKIFWYDFILWKILDNKNLKWYSRLEQIQNIILSRDDLELKDINRFEKNHRTIGWNALRAAVLWWNDGLVSNLSLIMWVAWASLGQKEIILTWIAWVLAWGLSMALWEWISVKSSQELSENQIKLEKEAIEKNPEAEKHEIIIMYMSKWISREQSEQIANEIMKDKQKVFQVMLENELKIDEDELKWSAMQAAIASFVLFSIWALIPILPYFFLQWNSAIIMSLIFSWIGLFGIWSAITLFTWKKVLFSWTRQLIFWLLAAAITFGIWRLIWVSIG